MTTDTLHGTAFLHEIDDLGHVWLEGGRAARVLAGVQAADLRAALAAGNPVLIAETGTAPVVIGVVCDRADDGRHLDLHASESLRLTCGEARLALTADGCLRLNGTHLHQRVGGLVRISGAQVRIN